MNDLDRSVVQFFEHTPHIRLCTDDHTEHIIPISVFEDVAEGRMLLTELDDWREISRTIINEWLNGRQLDRQGSI